MKHICGHIILLLFGMLTLADLRVGAQDRTVISGLGSDSLYVALVEQEGKYKAREDSLNNRIAEVRSLFRTDPDNRAVYSEDILRLESEIFDIRNLIGITAGKINAIEQEFIIRNLSADAEPGPASSQQTDRYPENSAVVVLNPFFSSNLLEDDYAILVDAQKKEQEVAGSIRSFAENYAVISRIASELEEAAEQMQADSLFSRYETLSILNTKYTDNIGETFGYIFDNKLYCYNFILDKLGMRNQLAEFERKTAQTREQAISAAIGAQSSEIAAYFPRKALILDYEKTLARMAGYDKALDSLSRAESAFRSTRLDFPAITVEEKLFLDFEPVRFASPAKYDSRNPIPDLKIHPKGEIYRLLLGSFQKAQQPSVLRGAYPVGVWKEDGRYSYYAGGYPTAEEAAEAVAELKSKGFKDPKVARWTNGQYKLFDQSELEKLLGKINDGIFLISLDTGGKSLPGVVKEILEYMAPGAEISRNGDLFIIGTFDSRSHAEQVMEEIMAKTTGIGLKIEDMG